MRHAIAIPLLASLIIIARPQSPQVRQEGNANVGVGINNGAINSGPCNITVINAKDSVLKVTGCNFGGLSAEEQAKELKRILSIARTSGITLAKIEASVRALADQSKTSVVQQAVGQGFANNNTTVTAPQTINAPQFYGRRTPLPNIVDLETIELVPADQLKAPQKADYPDDQSLLRAAHDYGLQVTDEEQRRPGFGVAFDFSVDRPFYSPAFIVQCSAPCTMTAEFPDRKNGGFYSIHGMAVQEPHFYSVDDDPDKAVVILSESVLGPGSFVVVKVRSNAGERITATIRPYGQ